MEFSREATTRAVIKYLTTNYADYLPTKFTNKQTETETETETQIETETQTETKTEMQMSPQMPPPMCFSVLCELDMVKIAQAGENEFLSEICRRFPSKYISMMNFRIVINKFRTYTLWNPLNVFCYLGFYDLFVIYVNQHSGLKINNMLLKLCYNIPNTHACIRYLFTEHAVNNAIAGKFIAQKDISLILKSLLVGHLSDIVHSLVFLRVINFDEVCDIYNKQLIGAFIAKENSIMEFIVLSFGSNQNEFLIKLHGLSYLIAQCSNKMCIDIIHCYLDHPELIPQYRNSEIYNYQSVIYLAVAAYEQEIFGEIVIDNTRLHNLLTYRGTIICEFFVSMLDLYSADYVVAHVLGVAPHCYSVEFYIRVLRSASCEQLLDIFAQLEVDTTAISSISGHVNPQSPQCEWIFTGRDRRFESRLGSDSFVPYYLLITLRVLIRDYLRQINAYFYGYHISSRDDFFNYMVKSTSGCNCPSWNITTERQYTLYNYIHVCKKCLQKERRVLGWMIKKYGYYNYHVNSIRPESEKNARDPLVAKWDRQIPPDVERGEVYPEGFISGQVFGDICDHRECGSVGI